MTLSDVDLYPQIGTLTTWTVAMQRAHELSQFWRTRMKVQAVRVRFSDGTMCYLYRTFIT